MATLSERRWIAWTSDLSPFGLKVLLLCQRAGLPVRTRPAPDARLDSWRYALRRERLLRGSVSLTWPELGPDDELPAVPFLFGPAGENLYDSSAIAVWLDRRLAPADRAVPEEPRARFVTNLIDDYADEVGLYLVHHNRWKVAALDNVAGMRVAREFRFLAGPCEPVFARWFAARQVRRLPYLFSVAPAGFHVPGLPSHLQPPALPGFPPTHALLEDACGRLLDVLEALLTRRPFVLGGRLTLADAALYGQLGMNLSDPSADQLIRTRAPTTHAWITRLHGADRHLLADRGALAIDADLGPLLVEIARVHLPLMRQNAAAYLRHQRAGERRFNEAAFDAGRALYDGELDGHPFRSVAKSFQAKGWRERRAEWDALGASDRTSLAALAPALAEGLGA